MARTRVTISLPADLAAKLKADAGDRPVSAYVVEVLKDHFENEDLARFWQKYLDEAGVTADDLAEADRVLDKLLGSSADNAA